MTIVITQNLKVRALLSRAKCTVSHWPPWRGFRRPAQCACSPEHGEPFVFTPGQAFPAWVVEARLPQPAWTDPAEIATVLRSGRRHPDGTRTDREIFRLGRKLD